MSRLILKLLFIGGAFYLLSRGLPLEQLLHLHPAPGLVLVGFLLLNLSQLLSAYRLHLYLTPIPHPLSFRDQLHLYYLGIFYNLALPGGVGGDGYKLYLFKKWSNRSWREVTFPLLLDRAAGVAGIFVIVAGVVGVVLLTSGGCRGVELASSWKGGWLGLNSVTPFLIGGVAVAAVGGVVGLLLLQKWWKSPVKWAGLLLGVGVQLLQGLSFGALLLSLGAPPSTLPGYLLLFYLSSLLSVLPISIGGVGIRELTLLYGSRLFQLDPLFGVGGALLFFLLTLGTGAVGGVAALFWREPPPPKDPPSN